MATIEDDTRFDEYYNSAYVENHFEHWLPSGTSIYENVSHLIPNHYLDVNKEEQIRYWPCQELRKIKIEDALEQSAGILSNQILSANKRYNLSLPLTAGWDSRVLMSATKQIFSDIEFYTLKYRGQTESSQDIRIPARLLKGIKKNHLIIDCNSSPSESFKQSYEMNTPTSHLNDWGLIAFNMIGKFEKKVVLKGNCAEIGRCFYYKYGENKKINSAQDLCLLMGSGTPKFFHEQLDSWFQDAKEISKEMHVNILDLFYWEHRMGSWQAQSQLEWDIAQESFTPFNHRKLIEIMLSVNSKFRQEPEYVFFKKIIQNLWPVLLKEPINPDKTFKESVKAFLLKMGIYKYIK